MLALRREFFVFLDIFKYKKKEENIAREKKKRKASKRQRLKIKKKKKERSESYGHPRSIYIEENCSIPFRILR
jgi:hypothetical protein